MRVRFARAEDARKLFEWCNDHDAREASRDPSPVSWEDHIEWIERNVEPGSEDQIVLIAEDDKGLVGVIRFSHRDTEDNSEVGINIAPERRGDGIGGRFLSAACARRRGVLVAEIRIGNIASRRIFEKCGFEWISEHKGFALYRRPALETV